MIAFGLIGRPLKHSLSPVIHRCFGAYDYRLLDVSPQEMTLLLSSRQFLGLNVTIPYKRDVLALCDEIAPTARAVGSANTLYFQNGALVAENTDLFGFEYMLAKGGISLRGKNVAVLGGGGTSLTAQAVCRRQGARAVHVVSRRGPVDYAALQAMRGEIECVVNTTPVGMWPHGDERPVDLAAFPRLCGVVDVIYRPADTQLTLQAAALGLPHIGGGWMLAAQGCRAAELFLRRPLPESRIDEAYAALCRALQEEKP